MVDAIIKTTIAIGAAVAAWYADKYVKEKTGKHIHEHVRDFVKALWSRLKNWAKQYLDSHADVQKVYVSTVNIMAAQKRNLNDGKKFVKLKIFGKCIDSPRGKVICEEEIPLAQIDGVVEQVKADPVLAMRY